MIKKNSCVRERYGPNTLGKLAPSAAAHHGFFLKPENFPVIHQMVPVFSQSKPDCFNDILMPMLYHMQPAVVDEMPFSEKKDTLFWRGSNAGGHYSTTDEWINFPRNKLLDFEYEYRKKNAEIEKSNGSDEKTINVDIAFVKIIQCDPEMCEFIESRYGTKPHAQLNETLAHKYLLVVDGNTWPSKLQVYLQSKSVVLYNGIFTDWYSWMLKPWVHYIPFSIDASDLGAKIEWIQKNPKLAENIGANARKLMARVSRLEQMKCYTCLLFLEYERLVVNGLSDNEAF
jgi:Glycosyl transferase family 90